MAGERVLDTVQVHHRIGMLAPWLSAPLTTIIDATLGDEWPAYRHPSRPEFVQTLPHVHGTSGFFVARLTVR